MLDAAACRLRVNPLVLEDYYNRRLRWVPTGRSQARAAAASLRPSDRRSAAGRAPAAGPGLERVLLLPRTRPSAASRRRRSTGLPRRTGTVACRRGPAGTLGLGPRIRSARRHGLLEASSARPRERGPLCGRLGESEIAMRQLCLKDLRDAVTPKRTCRRTGPRPNASRPLPDSNPALMSTVSISKSRNS